MMWTLYAVLVSLIVSALLIIQCVWMTGVPRFLLNFKFSNFKKADEVRDSKKKKNDSKKSKENDSAPRHGRNYRSHSTPNPTKPEWNVSSKIDRVPASPFMNGGPTQNNSNNSPKAPSRSVSVPGPSKKTSSETLDLKYRYNDGKCSFALDQKGGRLQLPFCTMQFPKWAVSTRVQMLAYESTMMCDTPTDSTICLAKPVFLEKKFGKSCTCCELMKKVEVRLDGEKLLAGASTPGDGWMELQITEQEEDLKKWKTLQRIYVPTTGMFSFKLQKFRGFRIIQQLRPLVTFFYSLVHCRNANSDKSKKEFRVYVSNRKGYGQEQRDERKSLVLEEQTIQMRPPCQLSAILKGEGVKFGKLDRRIDATKGEFNRSLHISIEKAEDFTVKNPDNTVCLCLVMKHGAREEEPTKFKFNWEEGSSCSSGGKRETGDSNTTNISVNGENATGIVYRVTNYVNHIHQYFHQCNAIEEPNQ